MLEFALLYLEKFSRARAVQQNKSDFLALLNHEFWTPLNRILGSAQLIAETSPNPETSENAPLSFSIRVKAFYLFEGLILYYELRFRHYAPSQQPLDVPAIAEEIS